MRVKPSDMVRNGEIELVGEEPSWPTGLDLAVYRETKSGAFRIGDRRSLWLHRWATEEAARANADLHTRLIEARKTLDAVHHAIFDGAPIDATLEAAERMTTVCGLLYRTADDLQAANEDGGDYGHVVDDDQEARAAIATDLDDDFEYDPDATPESRNLAKFGSALQAHQADRKGDPAALRDNVLKCIREYEAAWAQRTWGKDLDEGEVERRTTAQVDAGEALAGALIDQTWLRFGWEAKRSVALHRGTIYTPCGWDDDGNAQVLCIPIKDVIFMDEDPGRAEGRG